MSSISITYNGHTFRRYPDSQNSSDRAYYKPSGADRKKGIQALHQEVWKEANGVGTIPKGFHVHHLDHDTENNDPANLVLLEGYAHRQHHGYTEENRAKLAAAQAAAVEAAKAWHSSPEGLAWHAEHARESIVARPVLDLTCEQCGGPNVTQGNGRDRFCSNRCKAAWRRESGVDDEDRTCAACQQTFRINRYSRARTCSRKCAWVLRRAGD